MEQAIDGHIADFRIDDAVACLEQRPEQSVKGGDAASQNDGVIGSVEGSDFFFQPVLIWVAIAGVHQQIRRRIIDLRQVIGQLVAIGHVQRPADGSCFRIISDARMDGLC